MVSQKIKVKLPNGAAHIVPTGTQGSEFVASLSSSLAKKTLAMRVNGMLWDLSRPLTKDAEVTFLTWDDAQGKEVFWHSTSHVMAEALTALYPDIQLGIGPPIAQGFYYDVDFGNHTFDHSDLERVEEKMREIQKNKRTYERIEVSKADAIAHFEKNYNPYKLELIKELADGDITFYKQGDFVDLCKGPHLPDTRPIKAIKLLSMGGAYWRGDITKKQLVRIYGISFPKSSLLKEYLTLREEAKKRDHRKLGKELGFFSFSEEVGLGLPLWLPKGEIVREQLVKFLRQAQEKAGYKAVSTPHIGNKNLYIQSGHYEKYKEGTFQPIKTPQAEEEFLLKPMNCPHHCMIYKQKPHSYRDLPVRLAEFGTVYRYEQSGELHGLTRVRGFTQDDAHIFCRADQVKEEIMKVIDLVQEVFVRFAFKEYKVQLSLRDPATPDKYIGDVALWDVAEEALQEIVTLKGLKADICLGEAAFYGPKIDFMVQDALGREWQLGTVQIDYQLPHRFELHYIGQDNEKHRPVIIHRAPFGSLERFIAILIEHTSGKLPLWLAPEQVTILPVSSSFIAYGKEVLALLREAGLRASLDERDEKVGRKIRDAELAKTPYMLLVGEKEASTGEVALRKQGHGNQGVMTVQEFISLLKNAL